MWAHLRRSLLPSTEAEELNRVVLYAHILLLIQPRQRADTNGREPPSVSRCRQRARAAARQLGVGPGGGSSLRDGRGVVSERTYGEEDEEAEGGLEGGADGVEGDACLGGAAVVETV